VGVGENHSKDLIVQYLFRTSGRTSSSSNCSHKGNNNNCTLLDSNDNSNNSDCGEVYSPALPSDGKLGNHISFYGDFGCGTNGTNDDEGVVIVVAVSDVMLLIRRQELFVKLRLPMLHY
jgi:hypothetical protein